MKVIETIVWMLIRGHDLIDIARVVSKAPETLRVWCLKNLALLVAVPAVILLKQLYGLECLADHSHTVPDQSILCVTDHSILDQPREDGEVPDTNANVNYAMLGVDPIPRVIPVYRVHLCPTPIHEDRVHQPNHVHSCQLSHKDKEQFRLTDELFEEGGPFGSSDYCLFGTRLD